MALGTWDPTIETAGSNQLLHTALLQRLIAFDQQQQLSQLEQLLSDDDKQRLSGLMKLEASEWQHAAHSLENDELLHLIRFFAVAENLPGWEAGAKSPVIPLARMMRDRGVRLDKPLLQWLREVNSNRFLPYGPL